MDLLDEEVGGVKSNIFALTSLLVISIVVLLILRHYLPLRTTPAYLLVPIFFSLALPASIVLLVPIDLASSSRTEDIAGRGIWLRHRVLLVAWRITYWLTFVLTWFILPILAEYSDAGYREPLQRFTYSLRSNARYQAMVLVSAILGGAYVFYAVDVRIDSFKGLVMALAYCWGLILAIYLMGHGLVAIPRSLFRNSSLSTRLRRLQSHAATVHEKMSDAIVKLEDLEAQVLELSTKTTASAREHHEWIEELVDMSKIPETRPSTLSRRMSEPLVNIPAVITERYLADLTRQLDRARHSRIRWIDEWDRLLQDAADTQQIIDSHTSKKLEIGRSSPRASFLERFTFFTPYSRYIYYYHVVPYFRIFFGGFFSVASACVVWTEVVKGLFPALSIISLTVIHHPNSDQGEIGFAGQVVIAFWICYMCAAAMSSIAEVKVWRGRALVRRNTAYESAFWYAMQVARLTVPLSYNFMTFIDPPAIFRATVFYEFLGQSIDLTPLGEWFDYIFPIFILLPVCATLFGLYGKIKRVLGFGVIDDEDEVGNDSGFGTGGWREGRTLIDRELHGGSGSFGGLRHNSQEDAGTIPPYRSTPSERNVAVLPSASTTVSRPTPLMDTSPEDENFFEALGHRMRNTLDIVQKPDWLETGIKKPKWMSRQDDGDSNGPFTRLFGGSKADERRVRL